MVSHSYKGYSELTRLPWTKQINKIVDGPTIEETESVVSRSGITKPSGKDVGLNSQSQFLTDVNQTVFLHCITSFSSP